jgi:hypothetical protein
MGGTIRNLVVAGAVLALAAVTASAGSAHGVRTYTTGGTAPLATGLADPWLFNSSQRERALAMTHAAGASYVRLTVSWSGIAPSSRPNGFVATDPTSPGYHWSDYDTIVKQVEDAGLTPILDIEDTPKWAFAKKPSPPNAGTPKAADLGAFAKALAKHYDGSGDAPAVHVFQVWNEPNVSLYLNPVQSSTYRSMVNAFAASVHAVNSKNLVVAGALDPFGHKRSKKQKWNSVAPLAFMRSLLCLSKGAHPHPTCSSPIHFDAWSHHPYTFGGAFGHAKNPDDVELGDMPKMRTLLQAGVRTHHIRSTNGVRFWVTEFGWDTSPPRRHAAPMGLAARWTAESLYQAWRSGVTLLTWFGLQDRGGSSPYQSGLFRHSKSLASARVKPVRTAFRFPFVAYLGRGKVSIWGRDATSNKQLVTIQLRAGTHGHWRTVARIRANKAGIFKASLKLRATTKGWLRASAAGSGTSLAFSLTVPHDPHIGPWGN